MICCLLRYVPFFHMFVLFHCSFGHCFLLSFPTRRSSDLVHFDRWFSELSLYEDKKVIAALSKLQEKGNTYEKDGATWFKSTQFDDDTDRVLINHDGTYTYLTPAIAYHKDRLVRGYDKIID